MVNWTRSGEQKRKNTEHLWEDWPWAAEEVCPRREGGGTGSWVLGWAELPTDARQHCTIRPPCCAFSTALRTASVENGP